MRESLLLQLRDSKLTWPIQRAIRRFGLSVASSTSDLEGQIEYLFRKLEIQSCIDVGAHHGEFIEKLHRLGLRPGTIAIEPSSSASKILDAKSLQNVKVLNIGLGENSRVVNLYETGSVFASVKKRLDLIDRPVSERVELKKLDDVIEYLDKFPLDRTLLKIDTQGSELEILKGSAYTLKRIPLVLVEVPLNSLYEKTFTINDIVNYMNSQGFKLSGIHTPRFNYGKPFDCDMIFTKFELL